MKELQRELEKELIRIIPLISTSDNFYYPYSHGLRFALDQIRKVTEPKTEDRLCKSKWCLNQAIENSEYCAGHQSEQ